MTLRLYNTLTRTKEPFQPIDDKNVRMYVCGPTVYDFAHIGNARPVIVFDVLFRLLRHLYGEDHVTYVRNITDVDDKINARALRDHPGLELNAAIRKVTETTANQFHADVKALGCLEPTVEPRATDNIAQMIEIIRTLIAKGHAYEAAGEVLFNVASMKDYGQLSNRKLEEQQAGARVAVDAHKKNPGDFVLWKLSSAEEPGWQSPWGRGRPGWHIECSAMSERHLWQELKHKLSAEAVRHPHQFDIHGGGLDLIFPHHENEIAQSRCAHGTSVMANVWMHNGFLQVEGQKMSKSLGNFYTIQQVISSTDFGGRDWDGEDVRVAMLQTHYRQPIDWTVNAMEQARNQNRKWRAIEQSLSSLVLEEHGQPTPQLADALKDDLNFADVWKHLHELTRDATSNPSAGINLVNSLRFLGILSKSKQTQVDELRVEKLITARLEARKAKNWAESDRIRDELAAMGIAIKDNKDGTTSWEVKS